MSKSLNAYMAELPEERQVRIMKRSQQLIDEFYAPDYGKFMMQTVIIFAGFVGLGLIAISAFPNAYVTTLALSVVASAGYILGIINTKWPYKENSND